MKPLLHWVLLILVATSVFAEPRVWTATDGRTISAKLVDATSSRAILWREDIRREVVVSLDLLIGPHGALDAGWDLQIDLSRSGGDVLQARLR